MDTLEARNLADTAEDQINVILAELRGALPSDLWVDVELQPKVAREKFSKEGERYFIQLRLII